MRPEAARALALVDLTSLGEDDDEATVAALLERAVTPAGPVAAVCLWPRFVVQARAALAGTPVRVATVANFPQGDPDPADAVAQAEASLAEAARTRSTSCSPSRPTSPARSTRRSRSCAACAPPPATRRSR